MESVPSTAAVTCTNCLSPMEPPLEEMKCQLNLHDLCDFCFPVIQRGMGRCHGCFRDAGYSSVVRIDDEEIGTNRVVATVSNLFLWIFTPIAPKKTISLPLLEARETEVSVHLKSLVRVANSTEPFYLYVSLTMRGLKIYLSDLNHAVAREWAQALMRGFGGEMYILANWAFRFYGDGTSFTGVLQIPDSNDILTLLIMAGFKKKDIESMLLEGLPAHPAKKEGRLSLREELQGRLLFLDFSQIRLDKYRMDSRARFGTDHPDFPNLPYNNPVWRETTRICRHHICDQIRHYLQRAIRRDLLCKEGRLPTEIESIGYGFAKWYWDPDANCFYLTELKTPLPDAVQARLDAGRWVQVSADSSNGTESRIARLMGTKDPTRVAFYMTSQEGVTQFLAHIGVPAEIIQAILRGEIMCPLVE